MAFNGQAASAPTAADASALRGSPGHVVVEHADLANGTARAVVRTNRRATVVLSASYDPGGAPPSTATRPRPSWWRRPLVGVVVGPGVHTVTFTYGGYGSYDALFVLALVVLACPGRVACPLVLAAGATDRPLAASDLRLPEHDRQMSAGC